jgi:hypothetical protein
MSSERKFRGTFPVGRVAKKGEKRGSGWEKQLLLVRKAPQYLPNSEYKVGHYTYITDLLYRRVCSVSGYLRSDKVDRHTSQQTAVGKLVYRTGDAGGHLIACQFSGSGHAINMVPMNSVVNTSGAWGSMEREFAKHLRAGRLVRVMITMHYTGASLRPSGFVVKCTTSCPRGTKVTVYRVDNPPPR